MRSHSALLCASLTSAAEMEPRPSGDPAGSSHVEVRGLGKRYSGAVALEDVHLTVAEGEIHALVGENGAGKSTLGKVVAGAVQPDTGELLVRGAPVSYRSPREAIRDGIAIMDQELALVPTLSVLDNVFLGVERGRRGIVARREQRQRFRELAGRVGLEADASTHAGALSVADQQKVEILRALARDADLIVMDEPTAALTREEADRLLETVREVRRRGVTVIYVTHFLEDVLALADRVSVLKDGRLVRTSAAAEESTDSLVTAMLGRSLELVFPDPKPPGDEAPVVLSARGLSRPPDFDGIDLDLRAGEIVGLAGLVGSGRTEIARAIFGADPAEGTVELDGERLGERSPRGSIGSGIAMVPESRKDEGLVMLRSVTENVAMAHLDALSQRGVLRFAEQRAGVGETLRRVDARVPNVRLPVSTLSGGNQQKVAVGKWLLRRPRVLICDEPTRGVDVGAKRAIYGLLHGLAAEGIGILLISSELEEVLGLAHRVLVVRGGRIVAELDGADADHEAVMRAAFSGDIQAATEPGGEEGADGLAAARADGGSTEGTDGAS